MPLSKAERVKLILTKLKEAAPVGSGDEALVLIDQVFRLIEDQHSGVPYEPFHKDRLYPPVAEMEQKVPGKPWLRRYRHTSHYTLIAENGAIMICVIVRGIENGVHKIVGERTELDKPGADGRGVPDWE